jgi:hypothetical protein
VGVVAAYVLADWMIFGRNGQWLGSRSYAIIARNLVAGLGYTSDGLHPTAQRPPGYPCLLAGTMIVAGRHWLAATVLIQAGLAVGCLVLVFEVASLLWPKSPAAWLATGLLALHGPFMIEMLSMRETAWFTFGLLCLAWLLLQPTMGYAHAVAIAVCVAMLYLVRPTGLEVALVTIPFAACTPWNTGRLRTMTVMLLTVFALVLPWQRFTWRNFGPPGFFPSSLVGYNLFKGTLTGPGSEYPLLDADTLDRGMQELVARIHPGDESAADAHLERIARDAIRRSPGATLRQMLVNAAAFVSPLPIPLGRGRRGGAGSAPVLVDFHLDWKAILFAPLILYILVAGCRGVGCLLAAGGRARQFGLWTTVLFAVLLAVHSITFVKTRYRLPLDALLSIAAGGWLGRRPPEWMRRLVALADGDPGS